MTTQPMHDSVGAYALGILTPAECDVFEAHLAGCEQCALELEQLMEVATVLPAVEFSGAAAPYVAELQPHATRPAPVVSTKPRTQRAYALAAGVVLIAVGAVGGVVGQQLASEEPSSSTVATDPFRGEVLTAVNSATGVRARAALSSKGWGTNVTLELSKVRGPLNCELIAVGTNGSTETAMTWAVPVKGYGTPEQPKPLVLSGGSSIDRAKLDRLEVRTSDGRLLVSIPA